MKCSRCDKVFEHDEVREFCPDCGARLGVGEASGINDELGADAPGQDGTEPSFGVDDAQLSAARINALRNAESLTSSPAAQFNPDARMLSLDLEGSALDRAYRLATRDGRTQPLALEFDAARRYAVGCRGYLMLRAAAGQMRVEHGAMTLRTPDGRRAERLIPPLAPGGTVELTPLELLPDRAGEAFVDLRMAVLWQAGYFAHGSAQLLLPVERSGNLHIHAGRDIFGLDGIDEIRRHSTGASAAQPQWTPLDFHLGEALARRLTAAPQSVAQPPRRLTEPCSKMVPGGVALISLRTPGKTDRVFVYGGTRHDIGRNARDVLLAPRATLSTSVSGIRGLSKRHCEIRLEDDAALILDRSSAGTFIDGARLPKGLAVRLAPDDLVTLSDAVAYQVSLFGGREGIAGLLLAEHHGDSNPRRYLLLRSAVPLGLLFKDCDGWIGFDGQGFFFVADDGEEKPLAPGGQAAGGRLLVDEAIRCRGCGRLIVPLPEADACIHCRALNKD